LAALGGAKGDQGEQEFRMGGLSSKVTAVVTPAKAGVQNSLPYLDSGFRRNDGKVSLLLF
jgi:hypothetical protein